eukprot:GHVL01044237.1.p1 GENE.GHVL01044237.1~~GHVL01044237.1.p1  ORF type:complete len:653 (-),score=95.18 GHVL01044237.1:848-2806(-)
MKVLGFLTGSLFTTFCGARQLGVSDPLVLIIQHPLFDSLSTATVAVRDLLGVSNDLADATENTSPAKHWIGKLQGDVGELPSQLRSLWSYGVSGPPVMDAVTRAGFLIDANNLRSAVGAVHQHAKILHGLKYRSNAELPMITSEQSILVDKIGQLLNKLDASILETRYSISDKISTASLPFVNDSQIDKMHKDLEALQQQTKHVFSSKQPELASTALIQAADLLEQERELGTSILHMTAMAESALNDSAKTIQLLSLNPKLHKTFKDKLSAVYSLLHNTTQSGADKVPEANRLKKLHSELKSTVLTAMNSVKNCLFRSNEEAQKTEFTSLKNGSIAHHISTMLEMNRRMIPDIKFLSAHLSQLDQNLEYIAHKALHRWQFAHRDNENGQSFPELHHSLQIVENRCNPLHASFQTQTADKLRNIVDASKKIKTLLDEHDLQLGNGRLPDEHELKAEKSAMMGVFHDFAQVFLQENSVVSRQYTESQMREVQDHLKLLQSQLDNNDRRAESLLKIAEISKAEQEQNGHIARKKNLWSDIENFETMLEHDAEPVALNGNSMQKDVLDGHKVSLMQLTQEFGDLYQTSNDPKSMEHLKKAIQALHRQMNALDEIHGSDIQFEDMKPEMIPVESFLEKAEVENNDETSDEASEEIEV